MIDSDQKKLATTSLDKNLQRIMEACPVGIVVFDEDARVIYSNPLAEILFGRKSDDATAMKCGEFFLCANRLLEPKGCGHGPNCPSCPLFRSILLALSMSSPIQEGETPLAREAGRDPLWIKYKISAFSLDGHNVAVMAVDDITRRKYLEEELRENEEHFRHLYERVPLAYQSLDENGCFIAVNQAWLDLLGYSRNEVMDRWFRDFLAPEEQSAFEERFASFKEGGEVHIDLPMMRKDGCRILVHVDGKIGLNEGGRFKQTHCILHDITERERVEQALRASEEELKRAQQIAKIGNWSWDIETGRVEWSDQVFEIFKAPRKEPSYEFARSFVHPEDLELWQQTVRQAVERQGPFSLDYRIIRADGKTIWVHNETITQFDDHGELRGYQGTVQDVTERKLAEETLRESEQKFCLLFHNSLDAHVLFKDGKFVECNQAALDMLGLNTKEELFQLHPVDISPKYQPDGQLSKDKADAMIASAFESGSHRFEWLCRRSDGADLFLDILLNVIRIKGEELIHGVWRDVTEQKRAEEKRQAMEAQLRQVQKMQAIGTLSGGIAHEFNNILGIILGNAELAADDVPEWNPARFHLDEIKISSLRAKEVVRQLLTFSRKTEEHRQPFNLAPVVKETIKFLKSSIPSNIEFRQSVSDKCHTIIGNPTQVHQVLLNLSTNAAHAMEEEGGILEFRLQNVTLHETLQGFAANLQPGEYVMLQVSDTGCGIPADLLEHIFDPYFTTKGVGKGIGMGLSVVHGIVTAHGGAIQVQSEVGKGTTFRVFFPALEDEDPLREDIDEELPTGSERILFIDDEQAIAALGQLVLERLGYQVVPQTDPKAALELFAADPARFDLIVTDTTMPGMTGDKLIERVLQIRPRMKIILCTGYSERVDEQRALMLGAKAYAMKPLDKKQLARIVRRVLDSNI